MAHNSWLTRQQRIVCINVCAICGGYSLVVFIYTCASTAIAMLLLATHAATPTSTIITCSLVCYQT
jgi:hypothetical protein